MIDQEKIYNQLKGKVGDSVQVLHLPKSGGVCNCCTLSLLSIFMHYKKDDKLFIPCCMQQALQYPLLVSNLILPSISRLLNELKISGDRRETIKFESISMVDELLCIPMFLM